VNDAIEALRKASTTCFLCKWIVEDLEKHQKLTDWPPNVNIPEKAIFPVKAKEEHLKLEKFPLDFLLSS